MERLYRALVWLACVTLIVGVIASYLYGSSILNNSQTGIAVSGSGSEMSIAVFFQLLATQWALMLLNLSNLLGGGVVLLAATLAWATHRRIWLAALIIVTLATLIWPSVTFVLQTHYIPVNYGLHGATLEQSLQTLIEMITIISLVIPLVPVVLALIFGLTNRKPAGATAVSDAVLGIERSAL